MMRTMKLLAFGVVNSEKDSIQVPLTVACVSHVVGHSIPIL